MYVANLNVNKSAKSSQKTVKQTVVIEYPFQRNVVLFLIHGINTFGNICKINKKTIPNVSPQVKN